MYNKTSSSVFLAYGNVVEKIPDGLEKKALTIYDDKVSILDSFDSDVYIEPMEGMGLLRIVKNPQLDTPDNFAIHRNIRIKRGCWFRIVPMSDYIVFHLYIAPGAHKERYRLPEPILYHHIVPTTTVREIIAFYYVVKRPHYHFSGEVSRYYELTYVDHGSLVTTVEQKQYEIKAQQAMLYGPGQFHDQSVTSTDSCSYLTVIFKVDRPLPANMLNTVFSCSRRAVGVINHFVSGSDYHDYLSSDVMIASLQFFLVCLAASIIPEHEEKKAPKPISPINQHFEDRLLEEIIEYINEHLNDPLPVDQICQRFSISRNTLQNLFKNNLQIAPKQYINNAKLNRSRAMIRKGDMTISQIAEKLGFTSIHYFSRKFTASYGITPSEFARKIYTSSDD